MYWNRTLNYNPRVPTNHTQWYNTNGTCRSIKLSLNSFWIVNDFEFFKKSGNYLTAANVTSSVDRTRLLKLEDHDWKLIRRFEPRPKSSSINWSFWKQRSKIDQKVWAMTEVKFGQLKFLDPRPKVDQKYLEKTVKFGRPKALEPWPKSSSVNQSCQPKFEFWILSIQFKDPTIEFKSEQFVQSS